MTCTSHHHACDCREYKIAALVKAAQEVAFVLDESRTIPAKDAEMVSQVVERVYAACDELGVDTKKHGVAA